MRRNCPVLALLTLLLAGCAEIGFAPNEMDHEAVKNLPVQREPQHVVVEHILVGVEESGIPGVSRSREEAWMLAQDILERARGGEDFRRLMERHTDDRGNDGIHALANYGVAPRAPGEVGRNRRVRGFGDVAFRLEVGAFGLVDYDAKASPYGLHVLHRLR